MEREILFRGKRVDNGEWIEDNYNLLEIGSNLVPIIIPFQNLVKAMMSDVFMYQVDLSTVGQYTGLTDKNGVKIFEGDVCIFQNVFSSKPHIGVVRYYANAKPISDDGQYSVDLAECNPEDLEVIGNIHDNPEILKGEE